MKIIGIDPGLSGAIAVLENNKVLNIFDMPVMSEGKKNKRQLNSALLVTLIKENINNGEEVSVVVEQVNAMPGQGVTSMFNFGQTFGAIKGICAALELPIFFVRPSNYLKLNKEQSEQILEVLTALEELDDVQNIFTNANLKNLQ